MAYSDTLNKLKRESIINIANQVINYEDNEQSGILPRKSIFEGFSILTTEYLKEHISQEDGANLEKSFENSEKCIDNHNNYKNMIRELDNNNKTSFIIAPLKAQITTNDHAFSTIIYKKNDKYEFIVANKGYSGNRHSFEKYVVEEKNLQNVMGIFQNLKEQATKKIEDVYEILSKYSESYTSLTNLKTRKQRVGNCYVKGLEEAFKIVSSEIIGYKEQDGLVPKHPCKTEEYHRRFLKNLVLYYKDKSVEKDINTLIDIYSKNKTFREKISSNLEFEQKKKILMEVFKKEDVMKALEEVDERTLQEHAKFFVDILKEQDISVPTTLYNSTIRRSNVDFIDQVRTYAVNNEELKKDISIFKKYFPKIAEKLENSYNEKEITVTYQDETKLSQNKTNKTKLSHNKTDFRDSFNVPKLLQKKTDLIKSSIDKGDLVVDKGENQWQVKCSEEKYQVDRKILALKIVDNFINRMSHKTRDVKNFNVVVIEDTYKLQLDKGDKASVETYYIKGAEFLQNEKDYQFMENGKEKLYETKNQEKYKTSNLRGEITKLETYSNSLEKLRDVMGKYSKVGDNVTLVRGKKAGTIVKQGDNYMNKGGTKFREREKLIEGIGEKENIEKVVEYIKEKDTKKIEQIHNKEIGGRNMS